MNNTCGIGHGGILQFVEGILSKDGCVAYNNASAKMLLNSTYSKRSNHLDRLHTVWHYKIVVYMAGEFRKQSFIIGRGNGKHMTSLYPVPFFTEYFSKLIEGYSNLPRWAKNVFSDEVIMEG